EEAVATLDGTVDDVEPSIDVQDRMEPEVGEWCEVEQVGDREQRTLDGHDRLEARRGVEPASLDVQAVGGQDRQVHLAVELRQIDPGEVVVGEGAIEQAVRLAELPVVAEEEVESKAEIKGVVGLDRVLDDDVGELVALPLVGQAVGE